LQLVTFTGEIPCDALIHIIPISLFQFRNLTKLLLCTNLLHSHHLFFLAAHQTKLSSLLREYPQGTYESSSNKLVVVIVFSVHQPAGPATVFPLCMDGCTRIAKTVDSEKGSNEHKCSSRTVIRVRNHFSGYRRVQLVRLAFCSRRNSNPSSRIFY
jgi:hypothetical protein